MRNLVHTTLTTWANALEQGVPEQLGPLFSDNAIYTLRNIRRVDQSFTDFHQQKEGRYSPLLQTPGKSGSRKSQA